MQFFPVSPPGAKEAPSLGSDWILLLPAVTVGNVGQLAIDLLLTSTSSRHLGHVRSPCLLPFASAAYTPPEHGASIVTSAELYCVPFAKGVVYVLQQRSPPCRGRASEHAEQLVQWAGHNGCSQLIVLGSANAAGRTDAQIRDHGVHAMRVAGTTSATTAPMWDKCSHMGIAPMESVQGDVRGWSPACDALVEEERISATGRVPAFLPLVRKGAFLRSMLEHGETHSVAITVLIMFVHEGENSTDACALAAACASVMELTVLGKATDEVSNGTESDVIAEYMPHWKVPPSWHQIADPPQGLY